MSDQKQLPQNILRLEDKHDRDRLDSAFAELERVGIVAAQDYACCQSCGTKGMEEVMEELVRAGEMVRGYTFYHAQDTESASHLNGVYLAYGALAEDDDATRDIGLEIAATLQRLGLTVKWDGTINTRIFVNVKWERPKKRTRKKQKGGAM